MKDFKSLRIFLNQKAKCYNRPEFIASDPISIPHQFSKLQDIEIAGFFAATLAWGNRISILNSCNRLMQLMEHAPYDFVMQHEEKDLHRFLNFKHRTFNATDALYFIHFFKNFYHDHQSLETAFSAFMSRAVGHNLGS